MIYTRIMMVSWAVFLLVWGVSALFARRDIPDGNRGALWRLFLVLRLAAALLILLALRFVHGAPAIEAFLFRNIFTISPALGWAAAALNICGIGLALWARVYLGRNWSPRPAVKEGHELVTSGPYALVRHPIYTGLLLAMLGIALSGPLLGGMLLIIIIGVFGWRIAREERLMLERFPEQYPAYQKHTKRLVPFLW